MWPFKKNEGGKGFDFDTIIKAAKSFGFDIYEMIEKKAPEFADQARKMEEEAGCKLVGMINLSDCSTHFVISLYKMFEGGKLDLWKSLPLNDIKGAIDQFKDILTNQPDASDITAQPIATLPAVTPTTGNAAGSDDEHNWAAAGAAGAATVQQPATEPAAG